MAFKSRLKCLFLKPIFCILFATFLHFARNTTAVEKVKEQPNQYSLILMDIMMPKMNGDEAAKCIRKINPSIPIVAMSAQSEYSIDQTIMNDSISKPIDEQKLNHILSKYVA